MGFKALHVDDIKKVLLANNAPIPPQEAFNLPTPDLVRAVSPVLGQASARRLVNQGPLGFEPAEVIAAIEAVSALYGMGKKVYHWGKEKLGKKKEKRVRSKEVIAAKAKEKRQQGGVAKPLMMPTVPGRYYNATLPDGSHRLLKQRTGYAPYAVGVDPAVNKTANRIVTRKDGTVVISARTFLCTIDGASASKAGDVLCDVSLSPIYWIDTLAKNVIVNYERYTLKRMRIYYLSAVDPGTSEGDVAVVPIMDPLESLPITGGMSNFETALSSPYTVVCRVWENSETNIPFDPAMTEFYTQEGANRFTSPGNVQVVWTSTASITIGHLFAEFEIEGRFPRPNPLPVQLYLQYTMLTTGFSSGSSGHILGGATEPPEPDNTSRVGQTSQSELAELSYVSGTNSLRVRWSGYDRSTLRYDDEVEILFVYKGGTAYPAGGLTHAHTGLSTKRHVTFANAAATDLVYWGQFIITAYAPGAVVQTDFGLSAGTYPNYGILIIQKKSEGYVAISAPGYQDRIKANPRAWTGLVSTIKNAERTHDVDTVLSALYRLYPQTAPTEDQISKLPHLRT